MFLLLLLIVLGNGVGCVNITVYELASGVASNIILSVVLAPSLILNSW